MDTSESQRLIPMPLHSPLPQWVTAWPCDWLGPRQHHIWHKRRPDECLSLGLALLESWGYTQKSLGWKADGERISGISTIQPSPVSPKTFEVISDQRPLMNAATLEFQVKPTDAPRKKVRDDELLVFKSISLKQFVTHQCITDTLDIFCCCSVGKSCLILRRHWEL